MVLDSYIRLFGAFSVLHISYIFHNINFKHHLFPQLLQKIPNLSQEIEINQGLSLSEGLELFTKVIGDPDLPAEALEVCRLSRQNPFVISLIAINLKVYKSDRKRWIYWKNKLEKR